MMNDMKSAIELKKRADKQEIEIISKIKYDLKRRGINQEEVAPYLGTSKSQVSRLLNFEPGRSQRCSASIDKILIMLYFLGYSININEWGHGETINKKEEEGSRLKLDYLRSSLDSAKEALARERDMNTLMRDVIRGLREEVTALRAEITELKNMAAHTGPGKVCAGIAAG
jgi:predicted XRE-type DNA-binding protein